MARGLPGTVGLPGHERTNRKASSMLLPGSNFGMLSILAGLLGRS
jgi:hypothetical protein